MPPTTTHSPATSRSADPIADRIARLDWVGIVADLDSYGVAHLGSLLTLDDCETLVATYPDDTLFRSRVVMARHGFGKGEYKYFAAPLPPLVDGLRQGLYPHLVPVANDWAVRLGHGRRFPAALAEFLGECQAAGQSKPTPLLLRYGPGDYNCLHQDVYGEHVFPIQVAILLSRPGEDFTGGEFVVVEQRPRMQSRAEVVGLSQGDAIAFAVRERPVRGTKGDYRVNLRHGVSRIRSGQRHTLGVIFHDAG